MVCIQTSKQWRGKEKEMVITTPITKEILICREERQCVIQVKGKKISSKTKTIGFFKSE